MKANADYTVTEYKIAKAVLQTFRRADETRPLRDRKLFDSCRETLREGFVLVVWPERNKVTLGQ